MAKNQEVERIAKKLDKMVHKKNTDGALDLLRELKNIKMSLETLQYSNINDWEQISPTDGMYNRQEENEEVWTKQTRFQIEQKREKKLLSSSGI